MSEADLVKKMKWTVMEASEKICLIVLGLPVRSLCISAAAISSRLLSPAGRDSSPKLPNEAEGINSFS